MQYLLAPGRPGNRKPRNTPKTSGGVFLTPGRSIYSGADRLGHVVPHGGTIAAYDRLGNLVGSFPDIIAAVHALGGAALDVIAGSQP